MINIENITKSYNGKYKAVDNLNLEIKEGEIYGLLGPNGAGKTTTIKMITGIIAPSKGKIEINKIDISKEPIKAKEQFGYVPDNPDMFLRLTGIEYLNFMADVYNVSQEDRTSRIKDMSKRFEMNSAIGDKIQTYSHGMRQKIILMGVMVHNPRVWILDEPMTGLDPKSAFILKEMMREHADAGNTVIFSTHVLEVAEKVCDKVAIINKGQLIFNGTLSELRDEFKENESLEEMFLEITEDEKA
ncbi:ABC transporter ATP-binding protein [Clostridium saccharobutylicum]|uniref:ABC-type transporter ATP-binding protein EcsA n=1 Tax=Clostridium saccharobutylicum DSM 13864 TaxID=1345695 RepID=U5MRQ7_CLOSA|nr:ABC transporter ATP-binding protein [Clostridium saccharobutylicum]AGX43203.1 ABC-type transporter ATP-binding protein EcsA [Clostridium saccharobutylicum DSM 13864]AQR90502.1 ABC-type transporter ATP-binding protein EcsA [Clostridium saccharobutylicum]AQS00408.1 ABC-type transporter ATP-binding protein EcsA [Clostridium saccharobutylicum]AQS10057.1 ABC-type transporter ATP-binding protein EcsA [Clostridium saccharobutylicum]AQS14391.1 ABC-type transporter ATP-binding protein EcsA [Clostrid